MKKFLLAGLIAATMLTLSGCGNDKTIDGVKYEAFGIANETSHRDSKILYEISAGSVIVAIIFCETIIVPVYIVGWDLYQPIKKY